LALFSNAAHAQIWGIKLGPTIGIQNWDNGSNRAPLLRYHAAVFNETLSSDNKSALYWQAGYHVRGSAMRFRQGFGQNPQGQQIITPAFSIPYRFNNLSVLVGIKSKKPLGNNGNVYFYHFGFRGEYTISTNLRSIRNGDAYDPLFFGIFPIEENVRRFNYGVSLGTGIEIKFSEYLGGQLELNASPDLSRQYYSMMVPNVYNPITGQNYNLPEQTIRNVTFEISLGIRMLRKVIYID
jgi:hypothetical protein